MYIHVHVYVYIHMNVRMFVCVCICKNGETALSKRHELLVCWMVSILIA